MKDSRLFRFRKQPNLQIDLQPQYLFVDYTSGQDLRKKLQVRHYKEVLRVQDLLHGRDNLWQYPVF